MKSNRKTWLYGPNWEGKRCGAKTRKGSPSTWSCNLTFFYKTISAFAFNSERVRFSAELYSDSILNMESLLGQLPGKRLGRIVNSKLTTGSSFLGVEGIAKNSVAGKTASRAKAITVDEIIDLICSVDPAYHETRSRAFIWTDNILAAVRELKNDEKYLWSLKSYTQGVPQTVLGYPVAVNQEMESIHQSKRQSCWAIWRSFTSARLPLRCFMRRVNALLQTLVSRNFSALCNTAAIKHLVQ